MEDEHDDGLALAAALREATALDRHVTIALGAVAAAARLVAVPVVLASVVVGLNGRHYVHAALAVAVYAIVVGGAAVYLTALRGGAVPTWVTAVDVVAVAAAMLTLRFAVDGDYFDVASGSALEPFATAVLVGVAITARTRHLVWAAALISGAYLATVARASVAIMVNALADLSWQIGIAVVCLVGAQQVRRAMTAVGAAARWVAEEREASAEQRGREDEKSLQRRLRQRRYLEMHDGPLALLTAMSRPAPAGHPDPGIRVRCAANASLLRGLLSDDPERSDEAVPGLQLALTEAAADCIAVGLHVRFQFGTLPEDLPDPVVEALRGATRAALNNVVAHSGAGTAWVTADIPAPLPGDDAQPARITVDVVDRGVGFDPAAVASGLGVADAIIGRMATIGGAAEIDTVPGTGTWIRLRWPA